MNHTLSELMELNQKASSQKKINRPSDDPVGMSKILSSRDNMRAYTRYQDNIDTAKGWLGLADENLVQANTLVTRLKEIAEQAATGTMSADNREEVSYEARQLFRQLINIGNTTYENKHIFGGHKVEEPAFEETLWMTTNDSAVASSTFSIAGSTEKTILVRFLEDGTVNNGVNDLDYEYSTDGGKTFTTATLGASSNTLDLGGVQLSLEDGVAVTAYDSNVPGSANNGTWMWVRPTARYMGDDSDTIDVETLVDPNDEGLATSAVGTFDRNVVVRIDEDSNLASNISYSYSLDGGINWTTGQSKPADGTASSASIVIPGGYLVLGSSGGNNVYSGDQFVVHPYTAKIEVEISPNAYVQVNESGKDIFGGVYGEGSNASVVFPDNVSKNMFDSVGRLIGYLETNNQAGIQEALEDMRESSQHILNRAARIGARENRLEVSESMLETLKFNEDERLSHTEDVDITELMTKLASQEIAYQTIMRSSSNIMRMSLVNYL
jgi:flagellar hook-associated protein 3 FlgL